MSAQKRLIKVLIVISAALFRKKFFYGFSSAALLAVGFCFLAVTPAKAYVRLPSLIGSNMVLQRDIPLKIWGRADEGEKIAVSFCGQELKTTADSEGLWKVTLKPISAGGPFQMIIAGNEDSRVLENILVGDVWVSSGQSNAAWLVQDSNNAKEEIANSYNSEIRLFTVGNLVSKTPRWNAGGRWVTAGPKTAGNFSAIGYFFARELYKELKVPIGIISSAWGGTPAESWMSREALESDTMFTPLLAWWQKKVEQYPEAIVKYREKQLKPWQELAKKAQAQGLQAPYPPQAPYGANNDPWMPTGLYNAMISPLTNYAIKGVIWYQGESNSARAYQYRYLFPALITDWRKAWGIGDFSFLFVQLANFRAGSNVWAELREAQTMTLSLPKTGMAVTIDIGDPKDIHPKNKQDVGKRLSLAALKVAYDKKDIVYSGPIYDKMVVEKKKIRIYFNNVGSGLKMKEGDDELKGFKISGNEHRFSVANAKIEKNSVVVWSDDIEDPIAVRYGWADCPEVNLFNKEGLPASPFRTDDWPGVTKNRRTEY